MIWRRTLLALGGLLVGNAWVGGRALHGADVLVEAESFESHGGWVLDAQFIDQMGSPDLLAHGLGKPVAPARTEVRFPEAGEPASSPAPERPSLVVQTGHTGFVRALRLSPDGRYLASAGDDRTVKVWEVSTGRQLRTLAGHRADIHALAYSPDGRYLATGSDDTTAILWDVRSGRPERTLEGHFGEKKELADAGWVRGVAFSPDGRRLATGAWDRRVMIWDVETGQRLSTLAHSGGVTAVAFRPDGRSLASGTWAGDNAVYVWDLGAGGPPKVLRGHTGEILSLSYSPDGRLLASGAMDGTFRAWSAASGELVHRAEFGPLNDVHVAFDPGGGGLAVSSREEIAFWDARSWERSRPLRENQSLVNDLAFSSDGQWLAASSTDAHNSIRVWRPRTGEKHADLRTESHQASAVALSHDAKWLASAEEQLAQVWDLSSGQRVWAFGGTPAWVTSLAFSPAGPWLCTGDSEGTVHFWDASTGRYMSTVPRLAARVNSVAFNDSGTRLLTGSGGGTIQMWEIATLKSLWHHRPHDFPGAGLTDLQVGYDRGGHWMFAVGPAFPVRFWDVRTGNEVAPFGKETIDATGSSMDVSPDGKMAATGRGLGRLSLWEPETGRSIATLDGHRDMIEALRFNRDGTILASAGGDEQILLWEVPAGRRIGSLSGHEGRVEAVEFTPDSRWLFSASTDGTVRLWDVRTGQWKAVLLTFGGSEDWLVVAPDGLFDGSPEAWRRILWRFGGDTFDVAPVEIFFNEFYHPGLLSDILGGVGPRAPRSIAAVDRRQPSVRLRLKTEAPAGAVSEREVDVVLDVTEAPPDATHGAGSGVRDVRLFRNGSLVRAWRGDVLPRGASSASLGARVTLMAGENRLTAYAFNREDVKSSDGTLMVVGAESLQRSGTLFIVTIGVNRYSNPVFQLDFAETDAVAFAAELEARQKELGQFGRVTTIPLLNEDATKARILETLGKLAGGSGGAERPGAPIARPDAPIVPGGAPTASEGIPAAQPEDGLVVFFAGHGLAFGERFYLVPHDLGYEGETLEMERADLERALSRSISDAELEEALLRIGAGKLLLVIDACHSGQALESEERRRGPMNAKGLAQLAYEKGMYVLAASQAYQKAVETEHLGHGFLTYALVEEGLKTDAADRSPREGAVLLREWLDYAVARVPEIHLEMIGERQSRARDLVVVIKDSGKLAAARSWRIQRPRVFYRREPERQPMVVARPRP